MTTLAPNKLHVRIIGRTDLAPGTKEKYIKVIDNLLEAEVNPLVTEELSNYVSSIKSYERALLKPALKILLDAKVTELQSSASPENLAAVQSALLRIEAISKTIKVKKRKGQKSHIWLSADQIAQLTALPDLGTLPGRRDWLALALLCNGLRRDEAVSLGFNSVKRIPDESGKPRPVLDIVGKGNKMRSVQISPTLEAHIADMKRETGAGKILRSIDQVGRIGETLTGNAVYRIVQKYGEMMGLPRLQPHDLRRSYGMIIYANTGHDIAFVSSLLGHESIETTMQYLDLRLNLNRDASQYIPLSGD